MFLKVSEAAKQLDVCKRTIYRRIADGSLIAIRISEKDYRIDEKELEKFLQNRTSKNTA